MGAFAYAVPGASEDDFVIICIGLVLPMVGVDSPKYFCTISEKIIDVANALVHKSLPVPKYGSISVIQETGPGLPYTLDSFTHINCCTDDVVTAIQGGAYQQHEVFNGTARALKWLFPSLPGETKDSVSVNKLIASEGKWTCKK